MRMFAVCLFGVLLRYFTPGSITEPAAGFAASGSQEARVGGRWRREVRWYCRVLPFQTSLGRESRIWRRSLFCHDDLLDSTSNKQETTVMVSAQKNLLAPEAPKKNKMTWRCVTLLLASSLQSLRRDSQDFRNLWTSPHFWVQSFVQTKTQTPPQKENGFCKAFVQNNGV